MIVEPAIIHLMGKKLIGNSTRMSLINNKTGELWRSFIQQKTSIPNSIGTDLYSVQLYPDYYFEQFNLALDFEKWAAVEVTNFDHIPNRMATFELAAGLYAVFTYKGLSNDNRIFEYIFNHWLPAAEWLLDNRPHFEILGEKYKNNDPDSEEEI
ncbi:MAG: GyrI-like domain-containing protein [Chitinophagaceae bacterium]